MTTSKSKREILREKRKEQKRRRTLTFIFVILAAVIVFSLAAFLPKLLMKKTKYETVSGFSIGNPDAPVTVYEFSSYSCGHCKNYSENYESDFISKYVETGLVYFTYVNIPSSTEGSLAAAEASYCAAEQNLFYEYKELLYTYSGSTNAFSTGNLVSYASSAGLDTDEFQACLDSDIYADAYFEDYQFAQNAGLTGTPSFLVNDTLVYSSELVLKIEEYLGN